MDCGACAKTVEQAVAALPGVTSAQVSFGNGTMAVAGDAPDEVIAGAVARAGYRAQPAVAPRGRATTRRSGAATPARSRPRSSVGLLLAGRRRVAGRPPRGVVAEPLYLLSMAVGGWPIARAGRGRAAPPAAGHERADGAGRGRRGRHRRVRRGRVGARAVRGRHRPGGDGAGAQPPHGRVADGPRARARTGARRRRRAARRRRVGRGRRRGSRSGPASGSRSTRSSSPAPRASIRRRSPASRSRSTRPRATSCSPARSTRPARWSRARIARGRPTRRSRASRRWSRRRRAAARRPSASSTASRAIYTPLVFVAALLLATVPLLFGGDAGTWLYRALALLIVACPCSLVISVPVAVVSAVGGAARRGILIKGGQALEDLGRVRAVALDKTGTLTLGLPQLQQRRRRRRRGTRARARGRGRGRLRAPARRRAAPRGPRSRPDRAAGRALRGAPGPRRRRRASTAATLWAGGPRLMQERLGALPAGARDAARGGPDGDRARRGRPPARPLRPGRPAAPGGDRPRRRAARGRHRARRHAHRRHRARRPRRRRAARASTRSAPACSRPTSSTRHRARTRRRRRRDGRRRRQRRARARRRARRDRDGRRRLRRRARRTPTSR